MNTLKRTFIAVVLGTTFTLGALAAPPSKSKSVRLPRSAAGVEVSKLQESRPGQSALTCERMLVPNRRASKRPRYTFVTCTPEMMRDDARCQRACGVKS